MNEEEDEKKVREIVNELFERVGPIVESTVKVEKSEFLVVRPMGVVKGRTKIVKLGDVL